MENLIIALLVLMFLAICVNLYLQISIIRMVIKDCNPEQRAELLAILANSGMVNRLLLRLWGK